MKKSLMILLVCTLLTIISACANNNPGLVPSVPQYDYEYTTLEQLSENADNVIIGTVDSVEQADDSNYFYHIDGLSVIRGQNTDSITVYGNSDLINEGGKYCLFLYQNDSEFWPMPLTLFVDRESIFEIQSGKVIAPDRFGMTGMSEDELIDAATKLSMRENTVPTVTDELPYDKLIAESEAIFTATVKELSYSSPYSGGSAAVTVNKVFKGTAEKSPTGPAEENEIRMLVPQGLQVGETYLFFRTNGLAGMPTRNNSVISVESEEYAQIIEQIQ
jgi:hypothetical protein